jgi:hypothetical protein
VVEIILGVIFGFGLDNYSADQAILKKLDDETFTSECVLD